MTDPSPPVADPSETPERTIVGLPMRSVMLGTLIAAVVAITAGVLVALSADPADTPGDSDIELVPGQSVVGAPVAVAFVTFEGDDANTSRYVGRPLVLNFFAEWCPPCVAEMPEFEDVFQEVSDDVDFLGLSTIEPADNALELIERTGITYEVGRDPDGSAFAAFDAVGMPTTVFIDATGTVVEVHTGPLTADELRDRIDRHLR